ncbi:Hypothetical protein ADU72_1233 [Pediococcus damnosus]|uniref:Uncharacterized protein n=1 Tax=Pediococcus damnosus TaxID=51663 RepID=A0A0R2HL70_9LACO|nr:hypothetical protein [Pediococcus damnosus]AMV62947.1 Hypothetical protein ADU70_1463 [Pediococcus damnosus]AMV67166.1 Hypothetical protein ADU72_1233 [Pediococcus damnosus]AMV69230.1 Hypothetical protein ADU73_0824 [Pediococcus damnosus]KJU74851.1 hypothetical protein AH70_04605 [Pediococcus damnosus LMG 28219]KRN53727.1 hypothetical protein IV84_GL001737 [Pediococcus damnosus]
MKKIINSSFLLSTRIFLIGLAVIAVGFAYNSKDLFSGLGLNNMQALIFNNIYILLAAKQSWQLDHISPLLIPRMGKRFYKQFMGMTAVIRVGLYMGIETILALLIIPIYAQLGGITLIFILVNWCQGILFEISINAFLFRINKIFGLILAMSLNIMVHYEVVMNILGRAAGMVQ